MSEAAIRDDPSVIKLIGGCHLWPWQLHCDFVPFKNLEVSISYNSSKSICLIGSELCPFTLYCFSSCSILSYEDYWVARAKSDLTSQLPEETLFECWGPETMIRNDTVAAAQASTSWGLPILAIVTLMPRSFSQRGARVPQSLFTRSANF